MFFLRLVGLQTAIRFETSLYYSSSLSLLSSAQFSSLMQLTNELETRVLCKSNQGHDWSFSLLRMGLTPARVKKTWGHQLLLAGFFNLISCGSTVRLSCWPEPESCWPNLFDCVPLWHVGTRARCWEFWNSFNQLTPPLWTLLVICEQKRHLECLCWMTYFGHLSQQ